MDCTYVHSVWFSPQISLDYWIPCGRLLTRPCFVRCPAAGHGHSRLIWFSFVSAARRSITNTQLRISLLAVTGPPVDVGVTMYVLSISSVSEVLMVFTSSILLDHFSATRCTYECRIVIASLCTCVDLQFATTSLLVWFYIFICGLGTYATGLKIAWPGVSFSFQTTTNNAAVEGPSQFFSDKYCQIDLILKKLLEEIISPRNHSDKWFNTLHFLTWAVKEQS